jgi:hypothetical protein
MAGVMLAITVSAIGSVAETVNLSQGGSYSASAPPQFTREELVYEFSWEGVPAAEARWTAVRRISGGHEVVNVKGSVSTLNWLDMIWKLRGSIAAEVPADPIVPDRFVLKKRENSRRRDTTLIFDHAAGSILIERVGKSGHVRRYKRELKGQYDPISAAFALRGLPLEDRDVVQIDIQMGKTSYRLKLRVTGREEITVKAGTFTAIVLEPTLYNLTTDEPSTSVQNTRLWVSEDPGHIPLRLESSVWVGSVDAELTTCR